MKVTLWIRYGYVRSVLKGSLERLVFHSLVLSIALDSPLSPPPAGGPSMGVTVEWPPSSVSVLPRRVDERQAVGVSDNG